MHFVVVGLMLETTSMVDYIFLDRKRALIALWSWGRELPSPSSDLDMTGEGMVLVPKGSTEVAALRARLEREDAMEVSWEVTAGSGSGTKSSLSPRERRERFAG